MRYLIVFLSLAISSCQSEENDEQKHAHDELGNHISTTEAVPSTNYTIWTDKTELFVEFPALIVGKNSRFLAHFTSMNKHKPILEGNLTVSLIKGSKGIRHKVEYPGSPGIFTPTLQPKESGICQLIFELNTPEYSDRIVIENIVVYASAEEAKNTLSIDKEAGGGISFLKEQAWKIEFQTTPVSEKEIFDVITTSGIWTVALADHQNLVATSNGIVNFKMGNISEGSPVKKGDMLMTLGSGSLTSNNISSDIQKAKIDLDQAEAEFERKKELYDAKIVPKAVYEKVEQKYFLAKSNYKTLSNGYVAGGRQIVVPFDGYVKSIAVVNGGFVQQGTNLITITNHKSSLLEVQVSPNYAVQLEHINDLWYQPKSGVWSNLNKHSGKILSVGKEVESNKPLLSIYAQVNEDIEMPEGSFTEVQIMIGEPVRSLVIPTSSLLEDYGNFSVIVQQSGEIFERRIVTIGKRNGNEVEIKSGLKISEIVVSKGAYQVKMASLSGQAPAHGHEH